MSKSAASPLAMMASDLVARQRCRETGAQMPHAQRGKLMESTMFTRASRALGKPFRMNSEPLGMACNPSVIRATSPTMAPLSAGSRRSPAAYGICRLLSWMRKDRGPAARPLQVRSPDVDLVSGLGQAAARRAPSCPCPETAIFKGSWRCFPGAL